MGASKILVTGAGGFVGNRLTHRIALDEESSVKPMVHSISGPGTMRLSRLPIAIESGSILDADLVEPLLEDCDAVINCAHGDRETALEGTRTLLSAAERQDVDAYIHLSSAVVHGHDRSGVITESTSFRPDTQYAELKAETEELLADWEGDVQPTIFRPCIVYGPHSPWVENPLREVRNGAILAENGVGELNQIYVDNLVDALLCAVYEPDAAGEVFLAADDEPISWRQYYLRLGDIVRDYPPIQSMSSRQIQQAKLARNLKDSVVPPARLFRNTLFAPETVQRAVVELRQTPWAPKLYKRFPDSLKTQITGRADETSRPPDDADSSAGRRALPADNVRTMQSTRNIVSNEKLKDVLGWEQRISFDEAMEFVAAWARYEELVARDGQPSQPTGARAHPSASEAERASSHPQDSAVHQ